jgi:DEAD/DEAH box helicase domain-containing protein
MSIDEYIAALKNYPRLAPEIVAHEILPGQEAEYGEPDRAWPEPLAAMLRLKGIDRLYAHQVQAVNLIRAGTHTVVATPTASGKSLTYTLPVFEKVLHSPDSRSLFLFPLKALAQDQLGTLNSMASLLPGPVRPSAATYDGDTSSYRRGRIRKAPPNILLSNPEMLHLSMLPYHGSWQSFWANLEFVVVDEVHTYRGIMGSHMAWVFRRLQRICRLYGSDPTFVFCSATIANPAGLSADLTGLPVAEVAGSGAARAHRHVVLMNGIEGAAREALLLLRSALARGLRTIVYTQSRKMTELIALWLGQRAGEYKDRIAAYRSGFLPEERREIEARLTSGDLLAVVSTSALELGIDIGSLDLCILVGYPGSAMATWQRAGRVGRGGRSSAMVLIGHEDALDQYFMNHPDRFFALDPEAAVINPYNPVLMDRHLECAAAETPLHRDEPLARDPQVRRGIEDLKRSGTLMSTADDLEWVTGRKFPQRNVSLRGTGRSMTIFDGGTRENIGTVDRFRAYHETHPGAVYLHSGQTYVVKRLDEDAGAVYAVRAEVRHFTRPRSFKRTEILQRFDSMVLGGTRVHSGRLRVTEQVTGYEKRSVHGQKFLGEIPLELPPMVFETQGLWIEIPDRVRRSMESRYLHFMGGIHALEHAAIGILPLLVLADRNDLGGISIPMHPQVGRGAVFIYDGLPGGAGLTLQGFSRAGELLDRTLEVIRTCACETGCPACVHSPKCGSGNRPIDKNAARVLLEELGRGEIEEDLFREVLEEEREDVQETVAEYGDADKGREACAATAGPESSGGSGRTPHCPSPGETTGEQARPADQDSGNCPAPSAVRAPAGKASFRFGVMDLETMRSAKEVGGWSRVHKMGVSCAVLYDSGDDAFVTYLEDDLNELVSHMQQLDLVIGFNIIRFDYQVLRGYSDFDFRSLPTLDMLSEVHKRLGYRLSLDHLARHTLQAKKSADGLQALKWWKEGKLSKIIDYCRQDVKVTRDLYLYGKEHGHLLFRNKAGKLVKVGVAF